MTTTLTGRGSAPKVSEKGKIRRVCWRSIQEVKNNSEEVAMVHSSDRRN